MAIITINTVKFWDLSRDSAKKDTLLVLVPSFDKNVCSKKKSKEHYFIKGLTLIGSTQMRDR